MEERIAMEERFLDLESMGKRNGFGGVLLPPFKGLQGPEHGIDSLFDSETYTSAEDTRL